MYVQCLKSVNLACLQASIYSHCVITKQSVAKNDCAKEFLLYKTCLQKAVSINPYMPD